MMMKMAKTKVMMMTVADKPEFPCTREAQYVTCQKKVTMKCGAAQAAKR